MSIKQRMNRAEKVLKPKDQVILEWVETMTIDGEVIPYTPKPGEKVINLKWEESRDPTPDPDQGGPN